MYVLRGLFVFVCMSNEEEEMCPSHLIKMESNSTKLMLLLV